MKSRNGKIARLPHGVREELNQRLERSEPSPQLLAWLNALPAAREFVLREAHKANRDNLAVENQGPSQCVAVSRSDKIVGNVGSSAVVEAVSGPPLIGY